MLGWQKKDAEFTIKDAGFAEKRCWICISKDAELQRKKLHMKKMLKTQRKILKKIDAESAQKRCWFANDPK